MLYRPLTTFTYLLNYAAFGNADRPFGYHLFNLALHAANASLVLAIGYRLSRKAMLAVAIAALWAVHPVLTEAVTNIVGRADLLAPFGVLFAFYAHLRADERVESRGLWQAATAIGALIAVFAKENGVIVVALIAVYDSAFVTTERPWRDRIMSWWSSAVPVVLFLAARSMVSAGVSSAFPYVDNPIAGAGFVQGRLTALAVLGRYLALIVWPAHLSADYSFNQIPLATGTAIDWLSWIALLVFVVVWMLIWRHSRQLFFVVTAGVIAMLPAANLIFPTGTIMAERLLYLPSIAVVSIIVAAMFQLATAPRASLALGAVGVLTVACGVRTFARNADWRNELTLWQATVRTAPDSFKSHSAYAEALFQSDPDHSRLDEAIAEKEQSLEILARAPEPAATVKPWYQAAAYYLERGERHLSKGNDPANARADFARAQELVKRYLSLLDAARRLPNPPSAKDEADAYLLLSTVTLRLDDRADAVTAAVASRERQPFEPAAYRGEAAALIGVQRLDDAAVTLLTGFMVTGSQDLRAAAVQLYASGLDSERCATRAGASGTPALNNDCALVHRHLCSAAFNAVTTYERAGRRELAEQTRREIVPQFNCGRS